MELGNSTSANVNPHCTPVEGAFPDEYGPPTPGGGPFAVLFQRHDTTPERESADNNHPYKGKRMQIQAMLLQCKP